MKLKGKAAIVTGGGRGIGRAITLALAKEGASVVVSARTQSEIEEVAQEIQNIGQQGLAIAADSTRISDVEKLAESAQAEFGRIDILVNNAGGASSELFDIPDAVGPAVRLPIWEQSEAAWDQTIKTNLKSVFLCVKVVMPYMIAQGNGDVINIASRMGRQPNSIGVGGYGEAKHAVIALTKNAALQAASHGIRINAVSPGLIDTPGQRRIFATMMPEDEFPPMDSAESVAAGVLYLLCDAPKTMTGHSLDLFKIG